MMIFEIWLEQELPKICMVNADFSNVFHSSEFTKHRDRFKKNMDCYYPAEEAIKNTSMSGAPMSKKA